MRVIIAGSRDYTNILQFQLLLNNKLKDSNIGLKDLTIISGGARGVDQMGEAFAKNNGIALEIFPADWNKYGKRAGFIRNEEMAEKADALIAFWNGESNGTRHMIRTANKKGLKVWIFHVMQKNIDFNDYCKSLTLEAHKEVEKAIMDWAKKEAQKEIASPLPNKLGHGITFCDKCKSPISLIDKITTICNDCK